MKINTNLKALGVATMLTGFVLGGSATAFAEEGGKYERSYNSHTIIEFKPSDGEGSVTPPIDPTDPTNPTNPEPEVPGGGKPDPGTKGPLSIDYASSLDFGNQEITSTDKIYYAKAQIFGNRNPKEGPNYVQVTDNRGTEAGWSLQVKQNGQLKTEEGQELVGAEITFNKAWVNTASASPKPSIFKETFSLKPEGNGVAENIMTARAAEGSGTYVLVFGNDQTAAESIQLSVPGKATKYAKKYSASLTWTLTDVPGAGEEPGKEPETEPETEQE